MTSEIRGEKREEKEKKNRNHATPFDHPLSDLTKRKREREERDDVSSMESS